MRRGGGGGARGQLPEVKDRSEQGQARGGVGTWDPSGCSGRIPPLPTEEEHMCPRGPAHAPCCPALPTPLACPWPSWGYPGKETLQGRMGAEAVRGDAARGPQAGPPPTPPSCSPPPGRSEGGCVSPRSSDLRRYFHSTPPPLHAEGRARNGRLTSFPAVEMLSPALRHTPPWPLPDRQRAGGTEPPCGVVFGAPLGRGEGSWRSLSFPRVSEALLPQRARKGLPGTLPGAPLDSSPEGRRARCRSSGGPGTPAGARAGGRPHSPPPCVLGFWADVSWLIWVPLSGRLSCHWLLKNNQPWAQATTSPS